MHKTLKFHDWVDPGKEDGWKCLDCGENFEQDVPVTIPVSCPTCPKCGSNNCEWVKET